MAALIISHNSLCGMYEGSVIRVDIFHVEKI